ncbi:replication factor A protein [Trifolium repens]|nr:replication factor A protein [Trifolium repens]
MDNQCHIIGMVNPGKESWSLNVRVLRIWKVYCFMNPETVSSIEMVLIDERGSKIHASVHRHLINMFCDKIFEGNVYCMSHFIVVPETALYRSTDHPYKLLFDMETKVDSSENNTIDKYGFSLKTIGDVCGYGPNHGYLVDVVGLLTSISAESDYVVEGKVTKMVVLRLLDNSLIPDSVAYYCNKCDIHVPKFIPRFRLKLRVVDGTGEAVFVVFDRDLNLLVGENCQNLVTLSEGKNAQYYPPQLDLLIGRKMLFKVVTTTNIDSAMVPGSFKVERICSDLAIIDDYYSPFINDDSESDGDESLDGEIVNFEHDASDFGNMAPLSSANPGEVIDVADNSPKIFDVLATTSVDLELHQILSAKDVLSAASAECHDDALTPTKISKQFGK